jgi:hypothetical protein
MESILILIEIQPRISLLPAYTFAHVMNQS